MVLIEDSVLDRFGAEGDVSEKESRVIVCTLIYFTYAKFSFNSFWVLSFFIDQFSLSRYSE